MFQNLPKCGATSEKAQFRIHKLLPETASCALPKLNFGKEEKSLRSLHPRIEAFSVAKKSQGLVYCCHGLCSVICAPLLIA